MKPAEETERGEGKWEARVDGNVGDTRKEHLGLGWKKTGKAFITERSYIEKGITEVKNTTCK